MGSSDSSESFVLAFRLSTYSCAYPLLQFRLARFLPSQQDSQEVSRGHINRFPFMPTLITVRTLSLLYHATPQEF